MDRDDREMNQGKAKDNGRSRDKVRDNRKDRNSKKGRAWGTGTIRETQRLDKQSALEMKECFRWQKREFEERNRA